MIRTGETVQADGVKTGRWENSHVTTCCLLKLLLALLSLDFIKELGWDCCSPLCSLCRSSLVTWMVEMPRKQLGAWPRWSPQNAGIKGMTSMCQTLTIPSSFSVAQNHPEGLLKPRLLPPPLPFLIQVWSGWGPRICSYQKLPGDTDVLGSGTKFWELK